jgi:hypothetical protein
MLKSGVCSGYKYLPATWIGFELVILSARFLTARTNRLLPGNGDICLISAYLSLISHGESNRVYVEIVTNLVLEVWNFYSSLLVKEGKHSLV